MDDPKYVEGFDAGFDAAIKEFLYYIDQYDIDDIEFKLACTRISEDIRKYFVPKTLTSFPEQGGD